MKLDPFTFKIHDRRWQGTFRKEEGPKPEIVAFTEIDQGRRERRFTTDHPQVVPRSLVAPIEGRRAKRERDGRRNRAALN